MMSPAGVSACSEATLALLENMISLQVAGRSKDEYPFSCIDTKEASFTSFALGRRLGCPRAFTSGLGRLISVPQLYSAVVMGFANGMTMRNCGITVFLIPDNLLRNI